MISKTQLDKLGERLKSENINEDDLRLLDSYRRSFSEAYDKVVDIIRKQLKLEPTGRPSKSTTSIVDKLRRESVRLTQIQDIAGCRLIVSDIENQDLIVAKLNVLFENTTVIDRREKPSHGYRAVHVIVNCEGKTIEIQVRTLLQHAWAELSEKLADLISHDIKYGKGDEDIQSILHQKYNLVSSKEKVEIKMTDAKVKLSAKGELTDNDKQAFEELETQLHSLHESLLKQIRDIIEKLEVKGDSNVISN